MILSSDIAEAIKADLIAIPGTYWREITIVGDAGSEGPDAAYPITALTIEDLFNSTNIRLGIVPAVMAPNLGEYGNRDPSIRTQNVIYLVTSRVFLEQPESPHTVTSWAEQKKIIDFADLCELHYIKNKQLEVSDPEGGAVTISISEVEPTEPPEIELEQRVYMKITSLMFDVAQCK